jgi:DNA polymerase III alpha subunit
MSIVNIDTFEGQLNIVLFADEHEKFHEKIRKNNIIKVTGKLGERNGEVQVVANGVTIPRIAKK